MDPRWQPPLGPPRPPTTTPEACDLLAAGWYAAREECRIGRRGGAAMLVSLDTWRALRDRGGFVQPRVQMQR